MTASRRRPLVGGNWKMHKVREAAEAYAGALLAGLAAAGAPVRADGAGAPAGSAAPAAEIVLFPSFPLLAAVALALSGSVVTCGGQDLHPEDEGAHTGDVSGRQLADAGCTWVLCGHSERRRDHGESDALVGRKAAAAVERGLTPLVCVGETREQRRAGETFPVLERQLQAALAARPDRFALAYEPVWAIGTGETATPAIAQEAHRFLREALADLLGDAAAASKRIVYGGSVTPDNAAELAAQPDIDGFLVGGASLDPERFLAIIKGCGGGSG